MKPGRLWRLLTIFGAMKALAQPICPPINFQQAAQIQMEQRPQKIVSGLLRQAYGSFSQYNVTGNIQAKTASLAGIVPGIQTSLFTCSGRSAPISPHGSTPNLSQDPLGTASPAKL